MYYFLIICICVDPKTYINRNNANIKYMEYVHLKICSVLFFPLLQTCAEGLCLVFVDFNFKSRIITMTTSLVRNKTNITYWTSLWQLLERLIGWPASLHINFMHDSTKA